MAEDQIGRYRVLDQIAAGSQGIVYKAFDPDTNRVVAVKVLHQHFVSDETYLQRFQREATIAASIHHPNIVQIFEVGEDHGRHFMVMEHLPESVDSLIRAGLPTESASRLAAQIADGLQVAHEAGIVHRDIKPQNILIGREGMPKVTDFGIARSELMSVMTATGVLMGTPYYMSPEQARGDNTDLRSDVYSLGCLFYQLLTGSLPFSASTPLVVLRQQIDDDPPPIQELTEDIPRDISRIVERAMEKDPDRRYQSMSDMAEAIRSVVFMEPAASVAIRPAGALVPPLQPLIPAPTFPSESSPDLPAGKPPDGPAEKQRPLWPIFPADEKSPNRRKYFYSLLASLLLVVVAVIMAAIVIVPETDNDKDRQGSGDQTGGSVAAIAAPAAGDSGGAQPTAAVATAAPATSGGATARGETPGPAVNVVDFVPSGEATIAVNSVWAGVGTPRFCTSGCSEDVYITSIMETLFRPVYGDTLGTQPEAPILATGFALDPGLKFLDFTLREGVQFHDGWGEMTAKDVAFSFNDANRNTQPESMHGQAGDFAPLIKNFEVLDTYKVRLNYENYDSRGIRNRFSIFWQTAGIVSKAVFDDKGADGMRDFIIGTGPYKNLSWIQADSIKLEAVPNHWRKTPTVAKITYLEVPEASSRRAMLETGQVIMAQPALADWNALAADGFEINLDSGHGNIRNLGMTGNWWEDTRYYDGKVLERETSDKAWVSNTGPDGTGADADDYEAARLVRIGLAHAIDREFLQESILDGWGDGPMYFAYQPPNAHPITLSHAGDYVDPSKGGNGGAGGWTYPLDFDLAKEFITSGGFPDGFDMSNVWTGPPGLTQELMTAIGGLWSAELGVNVTLNNAVYSTYRPGLVARTTSEPFVGCGDDANTSMPYDWARGFVMSSWSDRGYGVGMEIPFAADNYAKVTLMTDKAERSAANELFAEKGIENALCIGLVHEPVGTVQNPELIAAYEKLPMANGNLNQMGNMESLVLMGQTAAVDPFFPTVQVTTPVPTPTMTPTVTPVPTPTMTPTITIVRTPTPKPNVRPVISAPESIDGIEGVPITLASVTFSDVDHETGHFATVDWGNGISGASVVYLPSENDGGTGVINAEHIFIDDGRFSVTIRVSDPKNAQDIIAIQFLISNSDPKLNPDAASVSGSVGNPVFLSGRVIDQGVDNVTVNVDWGDGPTNDAILTPVGCLPAEANCTRAWTYNEPHFYTDSGIFTVGLNATDSDGGESKSLVSVTVRP